MSNVPHSASSLQIDQLTPAQRAKLALRLAASRRSAAREISLPEVRPDPENRYELFPLSAIQQAYLVGRSADVELGNTSCHTYNEVEVDDWDRDRFDAALQTLIERHEMLRAIVLPEGRQRILREVPRYKVEINDLRGLDRAAVDLGLDAVRSRMSHMIHETDQWPLFGFCASLLDRGVTRLHISMDLLIADGRSFVILFSELMQLYANPDAPLPPIELSFRDYVHALHEVTTTPAYAAAREYWMKRVPTLPGSPELPLVKEPSAVRRPTYVRRRYRLEREKWQALKERAARVGVTPPGILLGAYSEVLSIWSKSPRFTLNLTLFNRLPVHKDANKIIGDFTSVNLTEVDNSGNGSFLERAKRQRQQLWRDLDNRLFGGIEVMREVTRMQRAGLKAVMPTVFTSLLSLVDGDHQTGWSSLLGRPVYAITQTPQVYLDFMVQDDDGAVILNWDSIEELFPEGMLEVMFQALCRFVEELAAGDEAWGRTLAQNTVELMPAAQLEQRRAVNQTEAPISEDLLHTAFLKQVDARPRQLAVITPNRKLTYQELFALACSVESELMQRSVKPNQMVAVLMEKGWEQVVAVMGIELAGGAYLPMDAGLPAERQRYLIEHGEVKVVLTQSALLKSLRLPDGVDVLAVDQLKPHTSAAPTPRNRQKPEDLAYVIYTSGSTGQPKGVMIDHRGAVNTILDINQRFQVGPQDRVLALSRLNFDLSVYDIFGMLAAGGALVIPSAELALDTRHWVQLATSEKVTLWNTVPALMQLFTEQAAEIAATKGAGQSLRVVAQSLRAVMMSGDWIPLNLPGMICKTFPQAKIWSLGGATEASIWSILYPIEKVNPDWKSVPYGKPMVNQTFHVLNDALAPCPVWVPGHLYIGGIGLAKGYARDEQKTNASFFIHPQTRERLYRTGDLGRYLPDGNIEFLGREDFQVKVNGHRIELGEIEFQLQGHPDVETCIVTVREDKPGEKQLVGYAVAREGAAQHAAVLRDYLRSKLPEYMVPASFVFLDRLPLSANGKVDRKALPAPARTAEEVKSNAREPRDGVELRLLKLWEDVLATRPIGLSDSFFDLGGSSLMAVRLFSQIEKEFGKKLPLAALFKTPTVERLAELLREGADGVQWSSLVPIRTSGSRAPVFAVHGHMGDPLYYRELAVRMGPDQPFYAFQARGKTGLDAHQSLEEMARDYIHEMRSVQPRGPYTVVGYCFGGRVAYEMAQQLHAMGERLSLLGIFALHEPPLIPAPEISGVSRMMSALTRGAPFTERVKVHFDHFKKLSAKKKAGYLWERARGATINLSLSAKLRLSMAVYGSYIRRGKQIPKRIQAVPEINLVASFAYQPKAYAGRATLMLNGPVPENFAPTAENGWNGLLAQEYEIHLVPGVGDEMFKEPHAGVLAKIITDATDRGGRELESQEPGIAVSSKPKHVSAMGASSLH